MTPALRLGGLGMGFGAVTVLRDLDLSLDGGSVHALLGANGAGKSTLIKLLTGRYLPTEQGEVWTAGVRDSWPIAASGRLTLAAVHQDPGLWDQMSILENIAVGDLGKGIPVRPLGLRRLRGGVEELLAELGVARPVTTKIHRLSPGERALVGVARALWELRQSSGGASDRLLILDEPTAALGRKDADRILDRIRALARSGLAVLFVTHRLGEVREYADTVTVLRDGHAIYRGPLPDTDREIERLMFGQVPLAATGTSSAGPTDGGSAAVAPADPLKRTAPVAIKVLSVDTTDLTPPIIVHKHEVVGITGLLGGVHETLPYKLVGVGGQASVEIGGDKRVLTPRSAGTAGVAVLPANRARDAIWLGGTVHENLVCAWAAGDDHRSLVIHRKGEMARVWETIRDVGVVPLDPKRVIGTLSGGNQQKVSLGRALTGTRVKVLIAHEPVQGIDLNARREVIALIRRFAVEAGAAVGISSVDYELLAEACDRVLVFGRNGQVATELVRGTTPQEIEAACLSASRGSVAA
jgi:ribose transport system ATP-binding protein